MLAIVHGCKHAACWKELDRVSAEQTIMSLRSTSSLFSSIKLLIPVDSSLIDDDRPFSFMHFGFSLSVKI
jgi:hypothetical protein